MQDKFDWAGVAAAGIGAGVGSLVGHSLRLPTTRLGALANRGLGATASDIANAAARSLLEGSSFGDNVLAALPDTIGQTVGGYVSDLVTGRIDREVAQGRAEAADRRLEARIAAVVKAQQAGIANQGLDLDITGLAELLDERAQLASTDRSVAVNSSGKREVVGSAADVDAVITKVQARLAKEGGLTRSGFDILVDLRKTKLIFLAENAGRSIDKFLADYNPFPSLVSYEKVASAATSLGLGNDLRGIAYLQTVAIDGARPLSLLSMANPSAVLTYGVESAVHAAYQSMAGSTSTASSGASARVGRPASEIPNVLPNADRAVIDPRKLTDYALNPAHPVGGNKARVFESALGFNANNADQLLGQIARGVRENPAVVGQVDKYGRRFTVDIPVAGPKGSGTVRTGWIYKNGSNVPELTTLRVK